MRRSGILNQDRHMMKRALTKNILLKIYLNRLDMGAPEIHIMEEEVKATLMNIRVVNTNMQITIIELRQSTKKDKGREHRLIMTWKIELERRVFLIIYFCEPY